jgi:hypothetical protein
LRSEFFRIHSTTAACASNPPAAVMSNWTWSNVSHEQLLRLVEAGQLPPLTDTIEWIVPADESVPRPPTVYVVSFVVFHEHGFSVPADRFIHGVLFAYGLQLLSVRNMVPTLTSR